MRKLTTRVLRTAIACALLASASCTAPFDGENGAMRLRIADGVSRTMVPAVSMIPARYEIAGLGPDESSFSLEMTEEGEAIVENLAFGDWTVTVVAENDEGTPIGFDEASVTVVTNETTDVPLTVVPYPGNGTFHLSVTWPAADVQNPAVTAVLVPVSGTDHRLAMTTDPAAGLSSGTLENVPAGYHTLTVNLEDNGTPVMGAVEVVRIVANRPTTGNVAFHAVNKATGGVEVLIDTAMADPLDVELRGSRSTKAANGSLQLTSDVAGYDGNLTFVWYVNGEAVATGAAFDYGTSWEPGHYRIDVTAFSADGSRAGSATAMTEVTAPAPTGSIAGSVRRIYGHSGFAGNSAYRSPTVEVDVNDVVHIGFSNQTSWPHGSFAISSEDDYEGLIDLGRATLGFGEGPDLAFDESTGVLHALIPGLQFGYDFFYTSSQDWTDRTRISSLEELPDVHEMYGEITAVDGIVHAMWRRYNHHDDNPLGSMIQYTTSADWADWEYVRRPIYGDTETFGPWVGPPAMAVAADGVVHALWRDDTVDGRLLHASSNNYTVEQDVAHGAQDGSTRRYWVSTELPSAPDTHLYPDFDLVAGDGMLYAVAADVDLVVYSSSDGGRSWATETVIGPTDWNPRAVQAVYRDGAVRVGVQADEGSTMSLWYVSSKNWTPRRVTGVPDIGPSIHWNHTQAFDYRNGRVYFVWDEVDEDSQRKIVLVTGATGD